MMNPLILRLAIAAAALRRRWHQLRSEGERGNTAEQTVLIALLVVLAITVVGIITAKVVGAANGITLP